MSAEQPFVHLHVHTEFSLLDGLSKIDKVVARAKELDMEALAITDHGAMFGVIQFYRACKKADIKPIIGMEGYLAKQDMRVHDQSERQPYHLLLLAKDETGYKNLLKIASTAQLEGFYSKPRIDKDYLAQHAEGIICTTGCLAAEIPRMITDGREEEAKKTIGWYQDVFGKDNFFLELQQHDIPEIEVLNKWLIQNRDYAKVPLLATNDVHYVLNGDFNAHDTLLCIQTGALKSESKRMKMTDPSYHLRSQHEMWSIFHEVPEALWNTVDVANMCNVTLDSKGYHLPVFPVPDGFTADSYLRYLAQRGLQWRYGSRANDEDVRARLDYELSVIHQMGFDTYFLIVWDLCQYAMSADIWWNVRGSGAGSVVAYCLGITSIDPLANNLIFERFLNPGRVSMPDIDMDFPDDRRMEMIDYAMRKYGSDKVAAIITFGTMKARAAIKDVGRVLDYPLPEVNILTKLIPQIPSRPVTLADCLGDDTDKAVPELKKMYAEDENIKTLLDTALTVEGVARNAGTHAAGVIIGDKSLVEYLPLHRPIGDTRVAQVTQFPMEICESIGLLKVDFLGLSTLTIMRKACDLIEKYHGIRYNMRNIPYRPDPDNPEITAKVEKAFDLIGRGETTGIFQLESSGMTRMLVEMKPKTFEHIIAAISLYRPGPMELIPSYIKRMHGREPVVYHHQLLEPILKETYGIIVYQEEIQQIAAQLFGYSLGDADLMRRAVSKKKAKDLQVHKQIFMVQGPENGVPAEVAEKIFDEIEYFAAYGFNKCVTYNTEIIDAVTGRLVRIGDLATGKAHLTQTLTCNTDRLRLAAAEVSEVMANGVKPVYRLTTNLGRQIEATANHPFYTFDGWKILGELTVGDRVAVPDRIPVDGKNQLADDKVIELANSLDFYDPDTVIPDEVFELTNANLELFIALVYNEHELVQPWGGRSFVGIRSKRAAMQLQHLLLRLGIVSRLDRFDESQYSPEEWFYSLDITDEASIFQLEEKIECVEFDGYYVPIRHQAEHSTRPEAVTGLETDIYWDQVVSIEYIGEQPTYDLTVPGTHNFVANDIIVHNSHAADYAVLTCQTAYLKAHFTEEYYTALLSVQRSVIEDVRLFTADCRRLGISILPPNINYSDLDFTIEPMSGNKRGIRYGLGAVKNAGEKAVQQIIDAREPGGLFKDISDFCRRVDLRQVGKRAIESLIKIGAFDELAGRDELLLSLDRILKFSADHHHASDIGQMSLFGGSDIAAGDAVMLSPVPVEKETPQREKLRWEKELVGLYVSEHPLNALMSKIRHLPNLKYSETLRRESDHINGRSVAIAGLVVAIRPITTKKGDTMAVLTIEDMQGNIDCVLFPRTWSDHKHMIGADRLIIVRGKADTSRGDVQIIVDNVSQNFDIVISADEAPEEDSWWETPAAPPDWAVSSDDSQSSETVAVSEEAALDSRELDEISDDPIPEAALVYVADPVTESTVAEPYQSIVTHIAAAPVYEPAPPDEESAPCRITLTIYRGADASKDLRRINRIQDFLLSYPGPDQFRFRLVDPVKTVMIDFPNHSTRYDGPVEAFLLREFDAAAIEVELLDS